MFKNNYFPKDYNSGVFKPNTWHLYVDVDVCEECLGGEVVRGPIRRRPALGGSFPALIPNLGALCPAADFIYTNRSPRRDLDFTCTSFSRSDSARKK